MNSLSCVKGENGKRKIHLATSILGRVVGGYSIGVRFRIARRFPCHEFHRPLRKLGGERVVLGGPGHF